MTIKVPAEKLAKAVEKHLLPGLLRKLREESNAASTKTEPQPTHPQAKEPQPIQPRNDSGDL
jgi:hypothetical protein